MPRWFYYIAHLDPDVLCQQLHVADLSGGREPRRAVASHRAAAADRAWHIELCGIAFLEISWTRDLDRNFSLEFQLEFWLGSCFVVNFYLKF